MSVHSTHFDQKGNAIMVDVSKKQPTYRIAVATGVIQMNSVALQAVLSGTATKGDVLGVSRIAGIMAVKQTPHLIPLCHPLSIEKVTIEFTINQDKGSITATCTVHTYGKTGVEMEALCGVNVALLTIYDMCKALDKQMIISGVYLQEKTGGKSGDVNNAGVQYD